MRISDLECRRVLFRSTIYFATIAVLGTMSIMRSNGPVGAQPLLCGELLLHRRVEGVPGAGLGRSGGYWRGGALFRHGAVRPPPAPHSMDPLRPAGHSEERRVGKACVGTCRFRWG